MAGSHRTHQNAGQVGPYRLECVRISEAVLRDRTEAPPRPIVGVQATIRITHELLRNVIVKLAIEEFARGARRKILRRWFWRPSPTACIWFSFFELRRVGFHNLVKGVLIHLTAKISPSVLYRVLERIVVRGNQIPDLLGSPQYLVAVG